MIGLLAISLFAFDCGEEGMIEIEVVKVVLKNVKTFVRTVVAAEFICINVEICETFTAIIVITYILQNYHTMKK